MSPAKSILEKPLKLLTEEDISQLTREDCRNYLKEKGMRKPSWNKSQAIQQVLSLKALLEPGEDSGAAILRKILVSLPGYSPRVTTTSTEPSNEFGACGQIPFQEDDGTCHRRDSPRSAEFSGCTGQFVPEKDSNTTVSPPSSPAETSPLVGQMTIFYSGKVNVYDGIPSEKAQSIMHFAANPIDLPETGVLVSNRMIPKPMSKDVEGQATRKVSLQRYLEKRKDRRFSTTKRAPEVASSSLEMFLNHQPRMKNSYSQNHSGTGEPHALCGSPENQTKSPNFSVDLNTDLNIQDI